MMVFGTYGTEIVKRLREKHGIGPLKVKLDEDGKPLPRTPDDVLEFRRERAAYRAELKTELRAAFRERLWKHAAVANRRKKARAALRERQAEARREREQNQDGS